MSRLRTATERLEEHTVLVGAVTVTAVVLIVALIFGGLSAVVFKSSGESVTATFSDTGALFKKSAEVRERGLKVGTVEKVSVDRGGRSATVKMELAKEGLPLYRDATAAIRWRSLLGGTVIVELDRGTPASGEMRSPRHIPLSRTSTQVEIEQVASVLRGDAQQGFKSLLSEMPKVLSDPAHPAAALSKLADVAPSVQRAASAIRADGDLRELVANSSRAVTALDRPVALRQFLQGTGVTLETAARRASELRRTVSLAADTQPRIQSTLTTLDGTLARVDPLIADLKRPVAKIAPALAELKPVLSRTSTLLHSARPLLRSLRPAATGLAAAARTGDPLLRELEPTLKRTDEVILRSANEKKDKFNGLTLRETLGPTMAVFDGLTAHFDQLAHVVRFAASISERELNALPCGTQLLNPSTAQLAACQSLKETINDVFNWQPISLPSSETKP